MQVCVITHIEKSKRSAREEFWDVAVDEASAQQLVRERVYNPEHEPAPSSTRGRFGG